MSSRSSLVGLGRQSHPDLRLAPNGRSVDALEDRTRLRSATALLYARRAIAGPLDRVSSKLPWPHVTGAPAEDAEAACGAVTSPAVRQRLGRRPRRRLLGAIADKRTGQSDLLRRRRRGSATGRVARRASGSAMPEGGGAPARRRGRRRERAVPGDHAAWVAAPRGRWRSQRRRAARRAARRRSLYGGARATARAPTGPARASSRATAAAARRRRRGSSAAAAAVRR